ncbi:MAG: glycosyltransferase family 2 protein [Chitinophaga sp.]|uniref:glycosyltransferase family 2 protein n=1 Tax=Chitinophaga sp. TaxID=1869181 RepID=UPI0025BC4870|nr:glycosyltransferase family 2 protein [Chitinophaga sp.]MBV8254353.1 glycosyltransferase family 2 protein [Chitinophaga sp.]
MSVPMLTIAIPTYNRLSFLDTCLDSIASQYTPQMQLEVVVSDNCSPLDPIDIIEKYRQKGLHIAYSRNTVNEGPDGNIGKCYNLGSGEFVWIIGDDDIILNGGLSRVFQLLEKEAPDFIHLGWKIRDNRDNNNVMEMSMPPVIYSFTNHVHFLKNFTHNITFISGSIIKRKFVTPDYKHFLGTNLVQLSFLLQALFQGKRFIYVKSPVVGVEPDNSGGFKVCDVFGKNLNQVLSYFDNHSKIERVRKLINNGLIMECFPGWIKRIRLNSKNGFTDSDCKKSLHPVLKSYPFYWISLYPILVVKQSGFQLTWTILNYPRYILNKARSTRKIISLAITGRKILI